MPVTHLTIQYRYMSPTIEDNDALPFLGLLRVYCKKYKAYVNVLNELIFSLKTTIFFAIPK